MKKLILILIFFYSNIFSQELNFAVLSSPEISDEKSKQNLIFSIDKINSNESIDFTVILGDLSKSGENTSLEFARENLFQLKKDFYVLPGIKDVKWNEFGTRKYLDFADNENFFFIKDNNAFFGLNSLIDWRGGGGHFSPETMDWFEEKLHEIDSIYKIILFIYYPLDNSIDNFHEVLNLLAGRKVIVLANSKPIENIGTKITHFELPKISESSKTFYQLFSIQGDSVLTNNITNNSNEKFSLINYKIAESYQPKAKELSANEINIIKTIELNKTLSAEIYNYEDRFFACTKDGSIYCYDSTGHLIWENFIYGTILNPPVAADGVLIVSSIEGDINVFDINTGKLLQTLGIGENITSQFLIIDFKGDKSVIIDNDSKNTAIVFGSSSGKLFCYDLSALGILWQNKISNTAIIEKPEFQKNKIFYENIEGKVFCVDANSGVLNWQWKEINDVKLSPASFNFEMNSDNIFISHPNKFIYAVDVLSARTIWKSDKYNASETIALSNDGNKIFVKSQVDKFYIINSDNGEKVNEINLQNGFDTMPVNIIESDSSIFIGSKNGSVYKIIGNNYQELLNLGFARINSIIKLDETKFAVSNMDSKIVIFKLKDDDNLNTNLEH